MSDVQTVYNRHVFGITELLNELGGFMTIVFAIGSFVASWFVSIDQKLTLVSSVFSVASNTVPLDTSTLTQKQLQPSDVDLLKGHLQTYKIRKSFTLFVTAMLSVCLKRFRKKSKHE